MTRRIWTTQMIAGCWVTAISREWHHGPTGEARGQEDGCDLSPDDYIKASQKKVMEEEDHSTLPPALREGTFRDRLAEETTLGYSDPRWS